MSVKLILLLLDPSYGVSHDAWYLIYRAARDISTAFSTELSMSAYGEEGKIILSRKSCHEIRSKFGYLDEQI